MAVLLVVGMAAQASAAQQSPDNQGAVPGQVTARGSVVSATDNTVVLRTDQGEYQLFVLDRDTARPASIPVRSTVEIAYVPTQDDWAPSADVVRVTAQPAQGLAPAPEEPVPPAIRQLERDVLRQAERYRIGIRGGSTLDPELFLFGVHSQLGPFFTENIWARPNFELGFGEVTTLVALNFEAAYRLPVAPLRGRWQVYAGGGPGLNFARQSFEAEDDRDRLDFSDLDLDVGFNFMLGIQSRTGTFMELKSSAYSGPRIRFQVGRSF